MRLTRKWKITIILAGIFCLLFNLTWCANYLSYNKYAKSIEHNPSLRGSVSCKSEKDGDTYSVKRPDYLAWHGNLGSVSEDGKIAIIVWPSLFCTHSDEYGVILEEEDELGNKYGFMFYVDENMNFSSKNYERLSLDDPEAAQKLLMTMKDQVYEQFQEMSEMFHLEK